MNKLICQICGYVGKSKQGFISHITHLHHIKSKDYYDMYLKQLNEGICPSCGKETQFRDMWYGYNKHCSKRCIPLDPEVQEKMKNTCQKRYGTDYAWQAEQTKDKIRQTTQKHFGVDCYLQTDECRKIIAENSASKEIKEKIKQTNLRRRGVTCSFKDENVKQKCKQAHLKNLGVENPAQSSKIRHKAMQTAIKNGNRSSLESFLEQEFIKRNIKYINEYKDTLYPYFCDFYLPDTNIYVEIHNWWHHGPHWFNKNSKEDQQILDSWIKKSHLPQYQAAINGWTKYDVSKRICAKNNKLNYVVLWNKQDIIDWINSNFEIRHDY